MIPSARIFGGNYIVRYPNIHHESRILRLTSKFAELTLQTSFRGFIGSFCTWVPMNTFPSNAFKRSYNRIFDGKMLGKLEKTSGKNYNSCCALTRDLNYDENGFFDFRPRIRPEGRKILSRSQWWLMFKIRWQIDFPKYIWYTSLSDWCSEKMLPDCEFRNIIIIGHYRKRQVFVGKCHGFQFEFF